MVFEKKPTELIFHSFDTPLGIQSLPGICERSLKKVKRTIISVDFNCFCGRGAKRVIEWVKSLLKIPMLGCDLYSDSFSFAGIILLLKNAHGVLVAAM